MRPILRRRRSASKDTDLAICLLWLLAFSPRSLACQIGAADEDQADELRKAAKGILRANAWLSGTIDIQANRIINPGRNRLPKSSRPTLLAVMGRGPTC